MKTSNFKIGTENIEMYLLNMPQLFSKYLKYFQTPVKIIQNFRFNAFENIHS